MRTWGIRGRCGAFANPLLLLLSIDIICLQNVQGTSSEETHNSDGILCQLDLEVGEKLRVMRSLTTTREC
jgi:hypothetical protein